MLCPKCGYITFDELPVCPKCKKDWADVKGKLNGFVTMTESPSFLNKILKDPGVSEAPSDDLEETEALDLSEGFDEGNTVNSAEILNEDIYTSDEVSINDDGLDLVLDELASLEDEEVEAEIQNSEIDLKGNIEFYPTDSEPSPPALDVAETSETTSSSTVNLHDIDLSDLMEPGVLENDEAHSSGSKESSAPTGNKAVPDLLGIDLSLEDDGDLLDLSLEPEVKPSDKPVKEELKIPDLGLSLDLDE